MWAHYRKSLVVTQLFILFACVVSRWQGLNWGAIATMFVAMQIGALLGAAWGHRIRRKMRERQERLPLQKD
jgi:uncharacterized membrane protein YfcA